MINIYLGEKNTKTVYKQIDEIGNMVLLGTVAAGKSIFLHEIIDRLIANKENVLFLLRDPKKVEFYEYKNCSTLLAPTDKDFIECLNILEEENKKRDNGADKSTTILFIDDEFSDDIDSADQSTIDRFVNIAKQINKNNMFCIFSGQAPSMYLKVKEAFKTVCAMKQSTIERSKKIIGTGILYDLNGCGDCYFVTNGVIDKDKTEIKWTRFSNEQ